MLLLAEAKPIAAAVVLFLLGIGLGALTNRFAALLVAGLFGLLVYGAFPDSSDTPGLRDGVAAISAGLLGAAILLVVLGRRAPRWWISRRER